MKSKKGFQGSKVESTAVRPEGTLTAPDTGDGPFGQTSLLEIAEEKRFDQVWRETQARYQALIQASPGIIFETDAQGNNTYVSEQWTAYTGMTPEETAGKGWRRALSAEEVEAEEARWQGILRSGIFSEYRTRLRSKDGSFQWFMVRALPTRNGEGGVVRWTGTLTNIEDLLKAQKQIEDQRAALEAVRDEAVNKKQLLEAVMESLPIGVAITDRLGGTIQANSAFEQIWGGPRPEARSVEESGAYQARWSDTGKALTPGEWASAQAVEKGRVVIGQVLEIERFDGPRLQVINSAAPVKNSRGEIIGSAVAIQDISSLRQAQEALRLKEADLSLVMDAVPALIASVDTGFRYRRVNRNYAQWFGFTAEEIQGRTMSDVLGEAQWGKIKTYVERALAGETITYERQLPFQGGESRWVRASYTPDVNQAGLIQGFVVHVMDIEERKKAEEAVRGSEENYRRILETANEGVVIGTLDGKMTFINQKWSDMLGYSKEEILGRVGLDFMDEDQKTLVLETRQHLKTGKEVTREFKFRRKDGSALWTLCNSSLFQDAGGNPVGFLAMHADITARRQAEQSLKESETRFRLLSETAGALLASPAPRRAVEVLCTRVMAHLDCQFFFNFLVDEPRGRLHLNAFAGIPEEEARKIEWLDYGVAVCGCAARDRQRIIAEDLFHQPDPRTDLVRGFGAQAYACHPIMAGDRLLGTLSFGTKTRSSFSPQDLELMKTVTDQVAAAMEKIRLLEMIQSNRDELELRVRERTSELKKANKYLAEQSRILDSFFKDTITPLVLLDRDFNFIRVNEAYARSCRRTAADFPGKNHFEFYPDDENEAIFRRVVETKVPFQALARPFSFPDHPEWGVTYWDWTLTPLLDDRGETALLVFSLEEVTDRQVAEEGLRSSERELRFLADQLLHTQENERKRIARDMHDSLGASLSAFKYKLEELIHNLPEKDLRQIEETLRSLVPILQETIGETRRMQNDLRPPLLDDLGILPTLSWFSREFQKIYAGIAIEQRVEIREGDVPERLKVVIFRITQEALTNIGKHALATQVRIILGREQDRLKLVIRDNGMGFNYKRLPESAEQGSGMGLSSMRERAELSGGFYSVKSRPGEGTVIEVSWPLNKEMGVKNRAD
jgi:PAS domain S-box-containing protein